MELRCRCPGNKAISVIVGQTHDREIGQAIRSARIQFIDVASKLFKPCGETRYTTKSGLSISVADHRIEPRLLCRTVRPHRQYVWSLEIKVAKSGTVVIFQ